jgi:hypothetical protein
MGFQKTEIAIWVLQKALQHIAALYGRDPVKGSESE